MNRIFLLTGPPRVGKTTAFMKTIELVRRDGRSVGGMVSSEVIRNGMRVGFCIVDLSTGERGELASVSRTEGPRLGKYRVNLHDLESIGVRAIVSALKSSNLIAIDEIGPMELFSSHFREAVEKVIESSKPVLATIHLKASGPLLDKVRNHPDSVTWQVSERNRAELPRVLHSHISQFFESKAGV